MKNLGRMISPILGDDAIYYTTPHSVPAMRATISAAETLHLVNIYWKKYYAVPIVKWYHPKALWYKIKDTYYRRKLLHYEEVYDKLCQIINDEEESLHD